MNLSELCALLESSLLSDKHDANLTLLKSIQNTPLSENEYTDIKEKVLLTLLKDSKIRKNVSLRSEIISTLKQLLTKEKVSPTDSTLVSVLSQRLFPSKKTEIIIPVPVEESKNLNAKPTIPVQVEESEEFDTLDNKSIDDNKGKDVSRKRKYEKQPTPQKRKKNDDTSADEASKEKSVFSLEPFPQNRIPQSNRLLSKFLNDHSSSPGPSQTLHRKKPQKSNKEKNKSIIRKETQAQNIQQTPRKEPPRTKTKKTIAIEPTIEYKTPSSPMYFSDELETLGIHTKDSINLAPIQERISSPLSFMRKFATESTRDIGFFGGKNTDTEKTKKKVMLTTTPQEKRNSSKK